MRKIIFISLALLFSFYTVNGQLIATDFTLKNTKGIPYTLYDELDKGKAVWLCFFSITCGPCAEDVPHIQTIVDNNDEEDFLLMAIETFIGSNNEIDDFISIYGGTYSAFSSVNNEYILDENMFDINYTPQNVVVCPDRKYRKVDIEDVQLIVDNCSVALSSTLNSKSKDELLNVFSGENIKLSFIVHDNTVLKFELIDLLGNIRKSKTINASKGENELYFDKSLLNSGYYIIRMLEGNYILDLKKLIVY